MKLDEYLRKFSPELRELVLLIAGKCIEVRKSFLVQQGLAGTENVFGESQMALDVWADKLLVEALTESKLVREIASEERKEIVSVKDARENFAVVLDPLDGSSCIETNLAVGTIVGIFKGKVLQPGKNLLAAFYVLYGPLTSMVFSAGKGVQEFVLNDGGEFVLKKEKIVIPDGKIVGPGGRRNEYLPEHEKFISELERQGYKIRFSGSFVADFNQILNYGGVFTYPASKENPDGKLRLLFEANPISFIAKQAAGSSSDGGKCILGIKPEKISQRTALYVGSRKPIELIEELFKKK